MSWKFFCLPNGLKKTCISVSGRNGIKTAAMSPHNWEPAPSGAELIVHAAVAVKLYAASAVCSAPHGCNSLGTAVTQHMMFLHSFLTTYKHFNNLKWRR